MCVSSLLKTLQVIEKAEEFAPKLLVKDKNAEYYAMLSHKTMHLHEAEPFLLYY